MTKLIKFVTHTDTHIRTCIDICFIFLKILTKHHIFRIICAQSEYISKINILLSYLKRAIIKLLIY